MSTPSEALRAAQKPLKDQYRHDPSSAIVTLSSHGTLDASSALTCSLSTGAAIKKAGLHKAAGGKGFDASGELCSGDMLLESLVACFGVTIRAVATALGVELQGGSVNVEGDLDFRGTLGIKPGEGEPDIPVGFKAIRLNVRLDVHESEKTKVEKVVELSERYCVVLQTIKKGVEVGVKLGHVGRGLPDVRGDERVSEETTGEGEGMKGGVASEGVLRVN